MFALAMYGLSKSRRTSISPHTLASFPLTFFLGITFRATSMRNSLGTTGDFVWKDGIDVVVEDDDLVKSNEGAWESGDELLRVSYRGCCIASRLHTAYRRCSDAHILRDVPSRFQNFPKRSFPEFLMDLISSLLAEGCGLRQKLLFQGQVVQHHQSRNEEATIWSGDAWHKWHMMSTLAQHLN